MPTQRPTFQRMRSVQRTSLQEDFTTDDVKVPEVPPGGAVVQVSVAMPLQWLDSSICTEVTYSTCTCTSKSKGAAANQLSYITFLETVLHNFMYIHYDFLVGSLCGSLLVRERKIQLHKIATSCLRHSRHNAVSRFAVKWRHPRSHTQWANLDLLFTIHDCNRLRGIWNHPQTLWLDLRLFGT